MPPPLTDREVEEMEGRCGAATEGPWRWDSDPCHYNPDQEAPWLLGSPGVVIRGECQIEEPADRDFILNARTDLPRVLSELRAMRQSIEGVRCDLADARSLIAEVTDISDKPPRWEERAREFLDRAQSPTHEYLAEIVALRERVGALEECFNAKDDALLRVKDALNASDLKALSAALDDAWLISPTPKTDITRHSVGSRAADNFAHSIALAVGQADRDGLLGDERLGHLVTLAREYRAALSPSEGGAK